MTNILMAIALEKAQLWVYYNEKKQYRPEVVVVTTIIVEPLALNRALLIYAMATIGTITREVWESGMETLGRFAYGNDCSHVIAYSANDVIAKLFQAAGADTSYRLLQLNIGE